MTITHDPHAMRIAAIIERHIAPKVPRAEEALTERLNRLGTSSGDNERVRTSTSSSTTERQAMQRIAITADLFQVREDLRSLNTLANDISRMLDRIITGRQPDDHDTPDVPVCLEGQHGKEGAIEWGDPLCAMPAVKRDLCQRHYDAWRRHRLNRGIDTSRDFAEGWTA